MNTTSETSPRLTPCTFTLVESNILYNWH